MSASSRRACSSATTAARASRRCKACATTRRVPIGSRAALGLILHSIVLDPDDPQRIWVAISAAGVFYSGDGGATWTPRNKGTRVDFAA